MAVEAVSFSGIGISILDSTTPESVLSNPVFLRRMRRAIGIALGKWRELPSCQNVTRGVTKPIVRVKTLPAEIFPARAQTETECRLEAAGLDAMIVAFMPSRVPNALRAAAKIISANPELIEQPKNIQPETHRIMQPARVRVPKESPIAKAAKTAGRTITDDVESSQFGLNMIPWEPDSRNRRYLPPTPSNNETRVDIEARRLLPFRVSPEFPIQFPKGPSWLQRLRDWFATPV